jgi:glycogen synthase
MRARALGTHRVNAMRCDFSWETQCNEYLKLFAELLQLDAAALVKRNVPQKTAG